MEERVRVGKEEAGKRAFHRAYDKFQAKQEKDQTRQLLELAWMKVHVRISQWHIIIIISTSIQKITAKVWTYSIVDVKLHPHHSMTFHEWIKNISLAVKTGETEYFQSHEVLYYDAMPSVWKNKSVPIRREVMCIIVRFFEEAHTGKYPWTKYFFSRSFFSLDQIIKIKICHMVAKEHLEVIEGRQRLIAVDVIDSEEAAEDASIDYYGDDLDEEYASGLVGAGVT